MDSLRTGAQPKRRGTYLNAALTVNALLLGLVLVGNGPSAPAPAAQPPSDDDVSGRISAADQRKQIITELQSISAKMTALDARLKGPLAVKVMEMPKEGGNQPARAPK